MFEIHADSQTATKRLLPLASIAGLQDAEDTAQRMGKKARKVPVIVYVPRLWSNPAPWKQILT